MPKQTNYDLEFFTEINWHYIETMEGSPMDGSPSLSALYQQT
jgi:hypothetical protein